MADQPRKRITFRSPEACGTCEAYATYGLSCPASMGWLMALVADATFHGSSRATLEQANRIVTQLPEVKEMAEECALGLEHGEPAIDLRPDVDFTSLYITHLDYWADFGGPW